MRKWLIMVILWPFKTFGFKTFLHFLKHTSDKIVKFKLGDNIIRWIYCELTTKSTRKMLRRNSQKILFNSVQYKIILILEIKTSKGFHLNVQVT